MLRAMTRPVLGKITQSMVGAVDEFSPLDLNPTLWLDTSDTSTLVTTGSDIDQWSDRSGNNNHATASGTARPVLSTDTLNGFTGADWTNGLQVMSGASPLGASDYTVFIIESRTASGELDITITGAGGNGNDGDTVYSANTSNVIVYDGTGNLITSTDTVADGTANLYAYTRTAAGLYELYVNGVSQGSANGNVFAGTDTPYRLGRHGGGASRRGPMWFILVIPKVVTAEEMNQVNDYVQRTFGV